MLLILGLSIKATFLTDNKIQSRILYIIKTYKDTSSLDQWERVRVKPATSASLGQRLNQSMVQPDISAGNFSARLRNFSPTGEKHRTTWRLCRTRDIKYSYRFSLVGGRRGNSLLIVGMRSLRISSISSRANKLDTWKQEYSYCFTEIT